MIKKVLFYILSIFLTLIVSLYLFKYYIYNQCNILYSGCINKSYESILSEDIDNIEYKDINERKVHQILYKFQRSMETLLGEKNDPYIYNIVTGGYNAYIFDIEINNNLTGILAIYYKGNTGGDMTFRLSNGVGGGKWLDTILPLTGDYKILGQELVGSNISVDDQNQGELLINKIIFKNIILPIPYVKIVIGYKQLYQNILRDTYDFIEIKGVLNSDFQPIYPSSTASFHGVSFDYMNNYY